MFYHFYSLDELGLPRVAWGGAFLDVFGGAGTSMDLGGFDDTTDISQTNLTTALLLTVLEGEMLYGVDAGEAFWKLFSTMQEAENIGYSLDSISSRAMQGVANTLNQMGAIIGDALLDPIGTLEDLSQALLDAMKEATEAVAESASNAYNEFLEAISSISLVRDPLIIDLSGDGLALSSQSDSGVFFDMDGDGVAESTGWVTSDADGGDDVFLALDKNSNGNIDSVDELFKSSSYT
jgi:hypothetical protein